MDLCAPKEFLRFFAIFGICASLDFFATFGDLRVPVLCSLFAHGTKKGAIAFNFITSYCYQRNITEKIGILFLFVL